jgi:hypothetical protein
MDEQFAHPSGQRLLAQVRSLFEQKPIVHIRTSPVLFLCGGPVSAKSKTMRRAFLAWSKVHFPNFIVVLAEDAYRHTKIYDPPETLNLSEFENLIGSIANCILLFPESEGSFAELGFFSGAEIRRKVLVANNAAFQTKESFINLGPVRTIDADSFMSPTVIVAKRHGRFDFGPVGERLERLTARTRPVAFEYRAYNQLDYLEKFLITLEMINIFQLVTLESLEDCIRAIFDKANPKDLKPILSVLAGAQFILNTDQFFLLRADRKSLLELRGVQMEDVKARVKHYYQRYRPLLYRKIERARYASR